MIHKRIAIILLLISFHLFAQQMPPKWMFELVKETDLELVYGNEFPYINPLSEGNFGSPIIEGLLKTNEKILVNKTKGIYTTKTKQYFLFLCRKKKKNDIPINKNKSDYMSSYNYYSSFDYFLTFVVFENNEYKIKQIYKWYLLGMQEQISEVSKDLFFSKLISKNSDEEYSFDYLKRNKTKISSYQNYSTVVFKSSMGHTLIVCYNNEWYYYTKDYE